MRVSIWTYITAVMIGGCSSPSPSTSTKGQIVVALTIDWEGAYLSPDGLDALDALRRDLGRTPMTHFVSAAYFTKDAPDPKALETITKAVVEGDELAIHLH